MSEQVTSGRAGARIPGPELIVVVDAAQAVRMTAAASVADDIGDASVPQAVEAAGPLSRVLQEAGASITPLFPQAFTDRASRSVSSASALPQDPTLESDQAAGGAPGLEVFFHVDAPAEELEELAERLRGTDGVAGAYVRGPVEDPSAHRDDSGSEPGSVLRREDALSVRQRLLPTDGRAPSPVDPDHHTPDFTANQGYLDVAPGGVDARFGWTVAGGRGWGLRIIDCENGFRMDHEDLLANNGGVVSGTADVREHGTAVLGVIGGDRDAKGVSGMVADAWLAGASWLSQSPATAIAAAAARLRPGDFLLLEGQLPGPNRTDPNSDVGLIAMEWWPDIFAAIRAATARGIIVVEAAGNGFQDLDAAVYQTPATGFPASWRNPFDPANPQCGAVMVGAGAPPTGFNGSAWGPDRSRLDFSNHGRRVDTQGWGCEVTTTGYGDLQGGADARRFYTSGFNGTSSASPVVLGALAVVQGILRGRGGASLTPTRTRALLRATGSSQQDTTGRPVTQRIGNRPDVRQLLAAARRVSARAGDLDGDGRAEVLVTSPWGIGTLERAGSGMGCPVLAPNGTRFGGWLLNTADNVIGPVADFDGDRQDEVLVTSPWGIGILEQRGSTFDNPVLAPNGTRFGGWLLNTGDNQVVAVGDVDGDGRAEVVLSSPWGLGVLRQSGRTFENPFLAPNGTRLGEWLLNTVDNHVVGAADLDGDGADELLVTSPWGIGVLKLVGSTMTAIAMVPNGTPVGGWLLNTSDNTFGPMADYDGDGRAEILVTSPWGVGMIKLAGSGFTSPFLSPNGTRFGGWLLNTADNVFGPAADLDGDGRAELLVTSPWGVGVLEQTGATFANPLIAANGTRFGGWLLNTADNRAGSAGRFSGGTNEELLISSPWGMGLLGQDGGTFRNPVIAPNGTRFGGWLLNTADNELGV